MAIGTYIWIITLNVSGLNGFIKLSLFQGCKDSSIYTNQSMWYTILTITLNVNRVNAPTKRHRLAEWIQKQDPYICYLQETHFRPKETYRLKVRGWKNIFHANWKQKIAGLAILISDKRP